MAEPLFTQTFSPEIETTPKSQKPASTSISKENNWSLTVTKASSSQG